MVRFLLPGSHSRGCDHKNSQDRPGNGHFWRTLRHLHKNGQDAGGQPRYCLTNQLLGPGRTRTVSFHRNGQLAAQRWSACATETVSLLSTEMVMIGTEMVMFVSAEHKNSQVAQAKCLSLLEFFASECLLASKALKLASYGTDSSTSNR
jgi:hypothetical protein